MNHVAAVNELWQPLCDAGELSPELGVRALVNDEQIAVFRVNDCLYAISAIDPFTKAAVLSRGLVGDLQGRVVVASPIYKQHFDLETGLCIEDPNVQIKTWSVRENNGKIETLSLPN